MRTSYIKSNYLRNLGAKSILVLISFLSITTSDLKAENVDKIIDKHIKAHGGLKRWNNVKSLKITGFFTSFSIEKPFTMYKTIGNKLYDNSYIGDKKVTLSFDGNTGWVIDPWQEMNFARRLNSAEKNVCIQKSEFFTPFFNYKQKKHKVEYLGEETIDNIKTFVLKLTRANGKEEKWYINKKTYLEYKCESLWVDFARPSPSEVFFDDFRKVNGLVIPFFTERTFWQRNRVYEIKNIEINPSIDNKIFDMPRRDEITKLDFMVGKWDVKVEVWSRRNKWYNIGNTSSKINYKSTNMIEESITYERTFALSKIANYTYNSTSKKYRISVFNDLSSSFNVFEGNLIDNTLSIDNLNINFSKEKSDLKLFTQYLITKNNTNSFTVVKKVSDDNGKTWKAKDKFTYTRSKTL